MLDKYYPAKAVLVRNPLTYLSGGEIIGRVLSAGIGSVVMSQEFLTEHFYGGDAVDVRHVQVGANYIVNLCDTTPETIEVMFNNMTSGVSFGTNNPYNKGDVAGPEFHTELLVRPLLDDGVNGDPSKPFYHLPRAHNIGAVAATFDEVAPHTEGFIMNLKALRFDDEHDIVLYGNVRAMDLLPQGDPIPPSNVTIAEI